MFDNLFGARTGNFKSKFEFDWDLNYDFGFQEFGESHEEEIPKPKFKVNRKHREVKKAQQANDIFTEFINLNQKPTIKIPEEDQPEGPTRFKPGRDRYGKGVPDGLYERPQSREARLKKESEKIGMSSNKNSESIKGSNASRNRSYLGRQTSIELNYIDDEAEYDDYLEIRASVKNPFGRQPFQHHHSSKPSTYSGLENLESGWNNDFVSGTWNDNENLQKGVTTRLLET